MELHVWLLLGAGVVIAAIVAVRVAHRSGLPSLLIFLGFGAAPRRVRARHCSSSNPQLAQQIGLIALAMILAEGGLTTNWAHAAGRCPAALVLATVGRRRSASAVVACRARLAARHRLADRAAARRGRSRRPTPPRSSRCCARLPLPPRLSRHAGGRVRPQRRARGASPSSLLSPAAAHQPGRRCCCRGRLELVGGRGDRPGGRAARRAARCAGWRCPPPACTRSRCSRSSSSPTGRRRSRTASGFLAVYVAARDPGQRPAAAPAGHPGLRRGRRLARPDRPVRHARPAGLARPSCRRAIMPGARGRADPGAGRPAAVGARRRTLPFRLPLAARQAFLSWAGLRGAVPIVLATIPLSATACPAPPGLFNEVFVIVVVFTLLQGPTLPLGGADGSAVTDAGRAARAGGRGRAAGGAERRPAAGQVPAGSKLHGVEIFELRLPTGPGHPDRRERPDFVPRRLHTAAGRRPAADRGRRRRRRRPSAAARGQPRRQAGRLVPGENGGWS